MVIFARGTITESQTLSQVDETRVVLFEARESAGLRAWRVPVL